MLRVNIGPHHIKYYKNLATILTYLPPADTFLLLLSHILHLHVMNPTI